jgi:RES domain-containing protein
MDVYRINKEPYHTEPLSVVGSRRHGGRWNPKGIGILYTSRTPELALLETLVHLPALTLSELPQLWLSTLRLPDAPDAIFWTDPVRLPPYWRSGTLAETQSILTDWLIDPFCLTAAVPSVIIDLSYNLLLHPAHPSFAQIELVSQIPIPLDSRLRG